MTPFVADHPAPGDPLAADVARLMLALGRLAARSIDDLGRPRRLRVARLRELAGVGDDAIRSAAASGFLAVEGPLARVTRLGRSVLAPRSVGPPDTVDALLAALADAGTMAVGLEVLAGATDEDAQEGAWRLAGEAEAAGLAARWADDPDGPSVALTPLAAGRLGLRPARDGLRWLAPGEAEPAEVAFQPFGPDDETGFVPGYHDRPDRGLSPPEALAATEELAALARVQGYEAGHARERGAEVRAARKGEAQARRSRHAARRRELEVEMDRLRLPARDRERRRKALRAELEREDREAASAAWRLPVPAGDPDGGESILSFREPIDPSLPPPRALAGMRGPWPVAPNPDGSCGACGGRELGRLELCAWCHRWGLDHLLAPARPVNVAVGHINKSLRGGVG